MILFKKAIRAIWGNKKAYFACSILLSVGVFILVSLGIASDSLEIARDIYYKDYVLADVFGTVKGIEKSNIESIKKIQGLKEVNGRIVYDSRVMKIKKDEIVTLRLISDNDEKKINFFSVQNGQNFFDDFDIMLADEFLIANNLSIGDEIYLTIEGKEYIFNICASVQSPEYIYAIKDASFALPNPSVFSYGYVQESTLNNIMGLNGVYNDVCFLLENNYTFDDVKSDLEEELKPFGLINITEQKNQISASMIDAEIKGNKSMTTAIPSVFILMSMTILYMMLKRVIEQERAQIGTLKAFGYSNKMVILHYLFYGLIIGLVGGFFGVVIGYYSSGYFLLIYKDYYKIPLLIRKQSLFYCTIGICMSILGGILGAYFGSKSVLKLKPADAMKSKAPKTIKKDILKVLPVLKIFLTSRGSMSLRNIERNKIRSLFIVLGITFSFGLMALMSSMATMIDGLLLEQFTKIQIYDTKISFIKPVNFDNAIETMYGVKNVTFAEAIFEAPVILKHENIKTGVIINGIMEDSNLYKIYDGSKKINIKPPKEGIILTNGLAKKLNAMRGDVIYIESSYSKEDIKVIVLDIVTQNLGFSCYMESDALANLFETEKKATAVIFNSTDKNYIKEQLFDGKNVGAINDSEKVLKMYVDMMGTYNVMIYIFVVLATGVAFAIIYNTSTISLSERAREYATLRVLGLQIKEVCEIMAFEYWLLCFFAIILGIPFTIFLKSWILGMIEIDSFSIPAYTEPICYVIAAVGCLISVFFANRVGKKHISKFDLVEVLKERE